MKNAPQFIPLGESVELIMGQAPPSKDCNSNGRGTPFVKVGEFRETRPEIREWTTNPLRMARRTDVLLCVVGATCGKINLGEDCAIGRSVAAIRPNISKLDQFYLYYFMMTLVERLRSGSVGAAQTVISKDMIEAVQFPFVPLPEQQRIVGILDEAFDDIAIAKANADKNLQNARALLESYLHSVFTQHGDGWTEKTLDDVCQQITDGKHGDCADENGSGFYFLSAKDVKAGTLNYENARQIKRPDFEETHRRTNLEPGDILITNSGTIGRMAIAPSDPKTRNTTFQKSVAILKLIRTAIDSKYAFYCLSSGLTRFVNLSAGAAQKNLLLRDLRSYRFALPERLEQQRMIAANLDNFSEQTKSLESIYQQKLAALTELKKSMLHQAFTGAL